MLTSAVAVNAKFFIWHGLTNYQTQTRGPACLAWASPWGPLNCFSTWATTFSQTSRFLVKHSLLLGRHLHDVQKQGGLASNVITPLASSAYGDHGTAPQTTLQLAGAESLPFPQSFQHCANQLAYAVLIEARLGNVPGGDPGRPTDDGRLAASPGPADQRHQLRGSGLTLAGSSYLTRHSSQQIGERNPTVQDISHPAWLWDEQAVQSQRMEGLAPAPTNGFSDCQLPGPAGQRGRPPS